MLPLPLPNTNSNIKKFVASLNRGRIPEQLLNQESTSRLVQTLSFLHNDFGKALDRGTAAHDPFYALNELFQLFASSEHQFLNLMEEKANKPGLAGVTNRHSITEIQAVKGLVDKHAERLQDAAEIVQVRGGRLWKQSAETTDDDISQKADVAAEYLALTFKRLIRRAKAVSGECKDKIHMLSHDAVVLEAQRSIGQAESIGKLTFIAFIFAPLSFTTSFFGMNLAQLNGSGLEIWIWFVVSVPIMFFSLAAWVLDRNKLWDIYNHITRWFSWISGRDIIKE